MPFTPHREAIPYSLLNATNGTPINLSTINGIQNAMRHFAGRGSNPATLQGFRFNGNIQPALGVCRIAAGVSFRLQRKSVALPFTVVSGHDSFCMFAAWKLLLNHIFGGVGYGGSLVFEIVKAQSAFVVHRTGYEDWISTGGAGSIFLAGKLPQQLNLSPVDSEQLYLRITLDLADGFDDGDSVSVTVAPSPTPYWQGLNVAEIATYKNCDGC